MPHLLFVFAQMAQLFGFQFCYLSKDDYLYPASLIKGTESLRLHIYI